MRSNDERHHHAPHPAQSIHDDRGHDDTAGARQATTVEAAVRAELGSKLGGPRGFVESALPIALFTVIYMITDEVRLAAVLAVASALVGLVARLAQRSVTRYVGHGVIAIALAAAIAVGTGRAETAFLPGIVQAAAVAAALTASLIVRWPAAGFVIGAVLDDPTGWRRDPAIVRLANRLTVVLLLPMLARVAVQYPLYAAGEVAWLGVARVVLGWPLHVAALAVAGAILARGRTPLEPPSVDRSDAPTPDEGSHG